MLHVRCVRRYGQSVSSEGHLGHAACNWVKPALRVDRSEIIAGQPIKRVRDFLRRLDNRTWDAQEIAEYFGLARADSLIRELVNRKLLERAKGIRGKRGKFYQQGEYATRLTNARFLKSITRERADALIAGLLQRIQAVNEDKEFLYKVAEARVFGSYIDSARADLGDVDVAIRLERRQLGLSTEKVYPTQANTSTPMGSAIF